MQFYKDGICSVAIIPKSEITVIDFATCNQPAETIEQFYNRQKVKPTIVTNGGFFNMSTRAPVFNYVDEGNAKSANAKYKWGMGVVGNNRLIYGELNSRKWRDFVSGYPNLLDDSQAVTITFAKEINYKARRTLLGYDDKRVILVCVDSPGMNLVEAQAYMKKLGCRFAINLDGGGSTGMLVNGEKKTSIYHKRAVDNVVAIYTKDASPKPTQSISTNKKESKGIDVYVGQGKIDWKQVKADGVDFAMIKASQGWTESGTGYEYRLFRDRNFATNLIGAYNAGIKCGVYHYFTAETDSQVVEEATFLLNTINPHKDRISLWVAVDVESPKHCDNQSKSELTARVKKFMEIIEKAGYKIMLYTNPNYLKYKFVPNAFDDCDIWLAHYNVSKPYAVKNLKMWQYGLGTVKGIGTKCDMNKGYFEI